MSNNSNSSPNNSFSHAFLPGLILGLIVGAVAGAFLPDFLGGPKIPAHTSGAGNGDGATHARDRAHEGAGADLDEALEDAQQKLDEAQAPDAGEDLEGGQGEVEDQIPTGDVPPSDG